MADKIPSKLSNEALLKKEKLLKMLIFVTITLCLISLFAGIYLFVMNRKFNTFLIIPSSLAVFPALIANSLKEIRKEKKARNI